MPVGEQPSFIERSVVGCAAAGTHQLVNTQIVKPDHCTMKRRQFLTSAATAGAGARRAPPTARRRRPATLRSLVMSDVFPKWTNRLPLQIAAGGLLVVASVVAGLGY